MDWQEVQRRLLEGLHGEVRSRWGHISELEERLGLSGGYLNKLCKGKHEFKLAGFLKTLSTMGLDPRAFFARTLEIHTEPADYLEELAGEVDDDRELARIVRAALELQSADPPSARPAVTADASTVTEFAACPRTEQRRRLRSTARYRTHAFARAYLEHLDAWRYDHAPEAAALATEVAVHLLPALPGPQSERLSLQCLALGVFGAARRLKAEFGAAARAFGLALELARRERLLKDRANLLLRSSYLLKDFGHFDRALALLNEALVGFVQLGSRQDVGRALLDHGMMNCYAGHYEDAVLDLRQALLKLEGTGDEMARDYLTCYQLLAHAYEQMGDLETAEEWLATGERSFGPEHAVDKAKFDWSRANLAFKRGDYQLAEELLTTAAKVLAAKQHPGQEAVVSLDLVSVMLAQSKHREASDLAASMARLLTAFKNNRFAEAAVVGLIRAALEGELNQELVAKTRAQVEASTSSRSTRVPKTRPGA